MGNCRRSYRIGVVVFGIVAMLPVLACVYAPMFEPWSWEKDSSGFYFFRYPSSGEGPLELVKYVVAPGTQQIVAKLDVEPGMNTGAPHLLPASGDLAWLRTLESSRKADDGRETKEKSTSLVLFSMAQKKTEKTYPVPILDVEGRVFYCYSPVQDKLFFIREEDGRGVITKLDIASGNTSDISQPIEKCTGVGISEDGSAIYVSAGKNVLRVNLSDGAASTVWSGDSDIEAFSIEGEHLRVDKSLYRKDGPGFGRQPVHTLEEGEEIAPLGRMNNNKVLAQKGNVLYLLDVEAKQKTPLLWSPDSTAIGAGFSPDGKYLAFSIFINPDGAWLEVLVDTGTLAVRDVIIPFREGTPDWQRCVAGKAGLIEWNKVPEELKQIHDPSVTGNRPK